MKRFLGIVMMSLLIVLFSGCGGGGSSATSGATTGGSGGGSKGPFKQGSLVVAYKLDANGSRDVNTTTVTTDSKGHFSFSSLPWSGATEFVMSGQYLNENTGTYMVLPASKGLSAVANIAAGTSPTININILTDIAAAKIKADMANGTSITQAKESAKEDVAKLFNIDLSSGANLTDLDLTDGSGTNAKANTQLLLVSSALLKTTNPEQVMQQLKTDMADGTVDSEAVAALDEVKTQVANVDLVEVATNMEDADIGVTDAPSATSVLDGTLSLDNNISFAPTVDAYKDTAYTSNETTVNGMIGGSGPISISGGSYSIDGGPFVATAGTVANGQKVKVKLNSSANYSETTEANVTIGGADFTYSVTTKANTSNGAVADTTPNAFDFGFKVDQNTSTAIVSKSVTITGINTDTNISIVDGNYSINGGAFTKADGTISNEDNITIQHETNSSLSGQVVSIVTIGGVKGKFISFTKKEDKTPDAIVFDNTNDKNTSIEVVSNIVTIKGINVATPISILDGNYSINGGAFTSDDGHISRDDNVTIKLTTSAEYNTQTEAKLTINNSIFTFKVKTMPDPAVVDATPDKFSFATKVGVDKSTDIDSSAIVVSGINTEVAISIDNGEYDINGSGTFRSTEGNVSAGDTVIVRQQSSDSFNKEKNTTLTIGGVSGIFKTITLAEDKLPDTFSFETNDSVNVGDTNVISNSITISGVNTDLAISVQNGEYDINNSGFTTTNGTVKNGDVVTIRQSAVASTPGTSKITTVTIGNITTTFATVTLPSAPVVDTNPTPLASVYKNKEYLFNPELSGGTADSWSIVNKPTWATFNTVNGRLSGKPTSSNVGITPGIIITATNRVGSNSATTFSIEVKNHTPIANASNIEVLKNTVYHGTLSATDADNNETFTYELISTNVNGDINITNPTTGAFVYTPTTDYVGEGNFTFRVKDENNASSEATVNLDVRERVINLTANDDSVSIDEDTNATIDVLSNDTSKFNDGSDASGTTISTVTTPSHGVATIVSGKIKYTPTANYNGADSFTYTATTATGINKTATVTVTIAPVNDAPVAHDDVASSPDTQTVVTIDVLANDTDVDGDTLSVTAVGTPANGTASISSNKVVFTPNGTYSGLVSFSYTVSDNHGGTDTGIAHVDIDSNSSVAVSNAADLLETMDVQSDDIAAKIQSAEDELTGAPSTDKDAQVALELLNFAKIVNNTCIDSVVDYNDTAIGANYGTALPKFIFAIVGNPNSKIIDLKANPVDGTSSFSDCTRTILTNSAQGLKSISDKLGMAFSDPDYVFTYKDQNLTSVQAESLRAGALLAASQLNYIAAHNFAFYGGDLNETTESVTYPGTNNSVEVTYRNIYVNPAYWWMSSYYFLAYDHSSNGVTYDYDTDGDGVADGYRGITLADSQSLLASAKSYLQESANIAKDINVSLFTDMDNQRDANKSKVLAEKISNNLVNGTDIVTDDNTTLDLRPLFVANSSANGSGNGIDAFDFAVNGRFGYDCSYDENLSKINGYPTCRNGEEAGLIPREIPQADKTDLDEVIKSINIDGTTYTGNNMLLRVFGDYDYIIGGKGWNEDSWDARYYDNHTWEDNGVVHLMANYKYWDTNNTYNNDSRMQLMTRSIANPANSITMEFKPISFTSSNSSPRAELKAEYQNGKYDFGLETSVSVRGNGSTNANYYICLSKYDPLDEICIDDSFTLNNSIGENNTYKLSIKDLSGGVRFEVFDDSNTSMGSKDVYFADLNNTVKSFYDDTLYDPSHTGDTIPTTLPLNKFYLRVRNDNANSSTIGPDVEIGVKDVIFTYPTD